MADIKKSLEPLFKDGTKKFFGDVSKTTGGLVGKKFGEAAGKIAGKGVETFLKHGGLGKVLSPALQALGLGALNQIFFGRAADPEIKFAFYVEIDGIQCVKFAECDGIKWSMDVTKFREGGNYLHEVNLPGPTKFEPLRLKKGFFASSSEFYNWFKAILDSKEKFTKVTLSLVILTDSGDEAGRFNFYNAFMSSYEGPGFSATENALAFESMEITYDYFDFMPGDWLTRGIGGALQWGKSALSKMKF